MEIKQYIYWIWKNMRDVQARNNGLRELAELAEIDEPIRETLYKVLLTNKKS